MSGNNNSRSKIMVPEARAAMDKMEAAGEVGVILSKGCSGSLTSKEVGSIGGQMVKKMCPKRAAEYIRKDRTKMGYTVRITYIAKISG